MFIHLLIHIGRIVCADYLVLYFEILLLCSVDFKKESFNMGLPHLSNTLPFKSPISEKSLYNQDFQHGQ